MLVGLGEVWEDDVLVIDVDWCCVVVVWLNEVVVVCFEICICWVVVDRLGYDYVEFGVDVLLVGFGVLDWVVLVVWYDVDDVDVVVFELMD